MRDRAKDGIPVIGEPFHGFRREGRKRVLGRAEPIELFMGKRADGHQVLHTQTRAMVFRSPRSGVSRLSLTR
jgi:hypothetical protein